MHDLGKIAIDDYILRKPGIYTEEEYSIMKRHAAEGAVIVAKVLSQINDENFKKIAINVAHYHHEKWDGTGYPNGLSGTDIPLCARIMALADVFDALISERCYKHAMPVKDALDIIKKASGSHFDPNLARVFLNHSDKYMRENRQQSV
jgi:HD-GYP domain-containing protein (c-di-GMP phosphodiesterase class II)